MRRHRTILSLAVLVLGGSLLATGCFRPPPPPHPAPLAIPDPPAPPGAGVPNLKPSPPGHDFGTVVLGHASAPTTLTVTNVGTGPSKAIAVDNPLPLPNMPPGQFSVVSDMCSGKALGVGASCSYAVTFHPTTSGQKVALVMVHEQAKLTLPIRPPDGFGSLLFGRGRLPAIPLPARAPAAPVEAAPRTTG
jgi:hypothetical protein